VFVRVKLLCWAFELMTPIACGTIIIQAIFGLICLSLLSFEPSPPFEKLLLSFVPIQSKKKNYRTTPGPGSGPRPMGPARREMMRAAACHSAMLVLLSF
jgi:hypothetical protein